LILHFIPGQEHYGAPHRKNCDTPAMAVKGARLIVSMLSDDEASREAWTGEDGALAAAGPGAILVECSTVTPAWIEELAALARARGLELLDAPVTGSRVQAEGGSLLFSLAVRRMRLLRCGRRLRR
jgi:3-hydroxyisobutyrate dehydrogenase